MNQLYKVLLKFFLLMALLSPLGAAWAVCEEVINRAPSGFYLAEDLVATQSSMDQLSPIVPALGLQSVQRLGRWQIFRLSDKRDFFEQCAPKKVSVQQNRLWYSATFHPVLQNSQGQLAVVVPEIALKASNMDRLPQLEKKYALKRGITFLKVNLIFYTLPAESDLDEVLHRLSNEIGVEEVRPILQRKRYHLR